MNPFCPPQVGEADRLLVEILCRRQASDAVVARIDALWPAIIVIARKHRIHSYVARGLAHVAGDTARLTPATRDSSHHILQKATLLNMLRDEKFAPAARALSARGIPVVLLKGAALQKTVYSHPGTRLSRDIDILVEPADVDAALAALLEIGCRNILTGPQRSHYASHHFHFPLLLGHLVVELHWGLVRPDSPYRLPATGVMERAMPGPDRAGLLLESAEDQLLHAAAQSLSEGFAGLLRICDTQRILAARGADLDWDGLDRRAREGRLAPALALLVDLSRNLLGSRVPAGALSLRSRGIGAGLACLQPEQAVVGRFSQRRRGFGALLRFWLLPGARGVVLRHFLLGQPHDRDRPGTPPIARGKRLGLIARRAIVLLGLIALQVCAWVGRRARGPVDPGSITPASSGS
ncbi:MAG: nucleotidyltransferase family protein [Acidobacteriota bacterium]